MNYTKFLRAASAALMIVIAIFMLTPSAWAQSKFKTLYKFSGGNDGRGPEASLIVDAAGNLYGTTVQGGNLSCHSGYGCGTVFKLTPNSDGGWTESVLYSFTGGNDGRGPVASLILDAAGNLYGTTPSGGNLSCNSGYGCGTVFKLTPSSDGSWTESVLYSFGSYSGDGNDPLAGLIFDAAGNLYGTTAYGGAGGEGTVFELTPMSGGSWTESVLNSFTGGADGGGPVAGLTLDKAGNLYGTTEQGGTYSHNCEASNNCGVVFKLTPSSGGGWAEQVLHALTGGKDGGLPRAGLIFDAAGNLYGTAIQGGDRLSCDPYYGCGTVFKLTPRADGSWKEKTLYEFAQYGKHGSGPSAALISDQAGNLYGTTLADLSPTCGWGVVFKLAPTSNGGWHETVLHRFCDDPGASPYGGLVFDAAGNIYGTTNGDGSKTFGSVFEITP
jgi:uncharacterized repeat protein (TIGR03803 family)